MGVFLLLLLPVATFTTSIPVITQSGAFIGSVVYHEETPVHRFLGIPFAEPPVGNLRFKKPVPIQSCRDRLLNGSLPPSCIQYHPYYYPWVDKASGDSEDCLYLNIWVPESASQDNPKAVMFWIFSGGFSTGSNRLPVYDGHVLAAEGDVIIVTVNYRVGIFGFLSTASEDAPGNMGLFDVLEALKWVNSNIQAFGGDTNRITVFGNSAGARTAGLLTLSPLASGLFQRIIMESSSPLKLEKKNTTEQNLLLGQKVAKAVGCATNLLALTENPYEVIKCLREIKADELAKISNSFNPSALNTFVPIYGDEFVPIDPTNAIKNGNFQDVDVLAGTVKDEGSILLVTKHPNLCGPYGEKDPKINKSLGVDILFQTFANSSFKYNVVNHYLSRINDNDYDNIRSQVYHAEGDFAYLCPLIYSLESFGRRVKNVYYYYFNHQSPNTAVFAPWMGVHHFSEAPFVFGRPLDNPFIYTDSEMELSKHIIKLWTNFAKNGVPSSTWKKFPYVEQFYAFQTDDNYLKQHFENCEFFKPYFGV